MIRDESVQLIERFGRSHVQEGRLYRDNGQARAIGQ